MSSTEAWPALALEERRGLIRIARQSIEQGLDRGQPYLVELQNCPPVYGHERATFVTLELERELRGCIGTLEARRPLAHDVGDNSWSAAFQDPRFTPLTAGELAELSISISVLTEPTPMQVRDEDELLEQLRPGVDGLILEERGRRATFLPSVWDALQDPFVFVSQLKFKAALPLDYWSDELKFYRYATETFDEAGRCRPSGS